MSGTKGVNYNADIPRDPTTGQMLPFDGTMSKSIGDIFDDKRSKPAKAIQQYKDKLVETAGGPKRITAKQWILLEDMTWPLQVIIVGRQSLNVRYSWIKKDGDMLNTVERVNAAYRLLQSLRNQFYKEIKHKETTYEDLVNE